MVPFDLLRGNGQLHYTYNAEVLPTAFYQSEGFRPLDQHIPAHERVRIRKRGIYILLESSAELGKFDLAQLLLVLVQSVTLLAIAEYVTDFVIRSRFVMGE